MSEGRCFGHSIRFKITAIATLLVVLVLAATVLSLAALQRRSLNENLRDAIGQRADDLTDLLAGGAIDVLVASGGEDTVAQAVQGNHVIVAAPSIQGQPPLAPTPLGTEDTWHRVGQLTAGGEAHLVLSRNIDTPRGVITLHVAGSLGDIEEANRALLKALALLVPLAALVLAIATWWLVGQTLSPVEAMRAEVDEMGGRDLRRRVAQPRGGDEIARLALTMNQMLDRVEVAHLAQDQFVADASHELRTPLTRMRCELELSIADPEQEAAAPGHRGLLEEIIHMQNLVDDLLRLASSDAGVQLREQELIDLDDIVFAEADRLRALNRRTVDVSAVSGAQVLGEPDQLRRAIGNLADNAERHAATTVTFSLCERQGHAYLSVTDDGPGVPVGLHDTIFERFGRADEPRSSLDGGTGLGLPIARDIVARFGGTVELDRDHHPGARFVVSLPLG